MTATEIRKELKANPELLERLVWLEEAYDVAIEPEGNAVRIVGYRVMRRQGWLFTAPNVEMLEVLLKATK